MAAGWEGGPEPHPAADAEHLGGTGRPVILALDASDGSCLDRNSLPWSSREIGDELGPAVRELADSRERIFPASLRADVLLDSSRVSESVLCARVRQLSPWLCAELPEAAAVVVESFGYPSGVPLDLGWSVDARVLRNPYWEPSLRMLSGLDPRVQDFVLGQPLAGVILAHLEALVAELLPELQARSRRILRVAIGCTGGYHRSVAIAEELGRRLSGAGVGALIWHRDLPGRP